MAAGLIQSRAYTATFDQDQVYRQNGVERARGNTVQRKAEHCFALCPKQRSSAPVGRLHVPRLPRSKFRGNEPSEPFLRSRLFFVSLSFEVTRKASGLARPAGRADHGLLAPCPEAARPPPLVSNTFGKHSIVERLSAL
jgi:hypothetical protein